LVFARSRFPGSQPCFANVSDVYLDQKKAV
jgi:hypothetical protein